MMLDVYRSLLTEQETIGDLFIDGEWFCHTLEDRVRPAGEKIPGATAIPDGSYRWEITYSPKFNRPMPLIMDVPGFSGIRIHPGNTHRDTEGCILVGEAVDAETGTLLRSRAAFDSLFERISPAGGGIINIWSAT